MIPSTNKSQTNRRIDPTRITQTDRLSSISRRTQRVSEDCNVIRTALLNCWESLQQLISDCELLDVDTQQAATDLKEQRPPVATMNVEDCIKMLAVLDTHITHLSEAAERSLDAGLDMSIANKYMGNA